MPDGIDQSWSYTDPATAKANGVQVVSMYLSHDPSKNATADKIKAYHAQGIGVLLNWESEAGRPLLGASAGAEDGHDAVAQVDLLISQVGYQPQNKLAIPFSCDTQVTSSQYPTIDAYYAATRSALGDRYINGVYGEADLVAHLAAAGLTGMEWQTIAWSNGRLDPEADFYQYSINDSMGSASVDYDRIIHADSLGAWWPPGHPASVSTASVVQVQLTPEDDLSILLRYVGGDVKNHDAVYQSLGQGAVQRWIPDPATLADRQARIKAAGGDPTVHETQHSRGYYGIVVGPDPEKL